MLAFHAAAEVMLSDGTTCTVNAPESQIRAKGYKHAELFSGGMTTRSIPFGSYLDASITGYEERYVNAVLYGHTKVEKQLIRRLTHTVRAHTHTRRSICH